MRQRIAAADPGQVQVDAHRTNTYNLRKLARLSDGRIRPLFVE
jgi:hypothetical protein